MSKKSDGSKGKESEDLSTTQSSDSGDRKRRLLGKLALGGVAGAALPTNWTKPVVNSVVLPAHAQTSVPTSPQVILAGGGGGGIIGPGPAPSGSITEDVLDFFINPAEGAALTISDYCVEIKLALATDGEVTDVQVTKYCFNACKPGTKWFDKTTSAQSLEKSGSSWTGTVANFPMTVTNINTSANSGAKVADLNYGGVPGEALRGSGCDCTCTIT